MSFFFLVMWIFKSQVPPGLNDDYHYNMAISQSLPRENDESTKLTKILTDFAEEIIDISVVEHLDTLEHQEVSERLAHYTHKLSMHGPKIVKEHGGARQVGLEELTLKEMGDQIENTEISEEDRTLVCRVAKQVENLVASMQVEQNEDTLDMVVDLGEEYSSRNSTLE